MEAFYYLVFGALAAVVAGVELSKSNKDRINTSSAFNSFKNNYLVIYSLMMGKHSRSHRTRSLSLSIRVFTGLYAEMYASGFGEFGSDLMLLVSFLAKSNGIQIRSVLQSAF